MCLLRTHIPFVWDEQAGAAFEALKKALTQAPLISPPDFSQDFILYVSASEHAVSGVLVQEDTSRQEHVIYYVSQTLSGPPLRYPYEERLALAVVFSVQKLRHYILLSHTTVVADSNPMVYLLNRWLLQGRVAKWVIILQEYDLTF